MKKLVFISAVSGVGKSTTCEYIKKNNMLDNYMIFDIDDLENINNYSTDNYNDLYRIKSSEKLFKYLTKYETFCKYIESSEMGDCSKITDFGIDDIAFYDENDNFLLFTTTHEGEIIINKEIL